VLRRFSTDRGVLVLGLPLAAGPQWAAGEGPDGLRRVASIDSAGRTPVFIRTAPGDTVGAIFAAFPTGTDYADAVSAYERGLGPPTWVSGSDTARGDGAAWRSAQWWTNGGVFVRLDSFARAGTPRVCLGMFDVRLLPAAT
jgi:hypothetical protein